MGVLQRAFDKEVRELPATALRDLIINKLETAGIAPDALLVERIVQHLDTADLQEFDWQAHGINTGIAIEDSDHEFLRVRLEKAVEAIPSIFDRIMRDTAKNMLNEFKRSWSDSRLIDDFVFEEFRADLAERWGSGLNGLHMLLDFSRHIGETNHKRHRRSKSQKAPNLQQALSNLHIRSCQVAAEIITLLENGYSDGAMARWRTLHEIAVTMIVISDSGEELARRYLCHAAVEAKQAMDRFEKDHVGLGQKAVPARDRQRIYKECDAVVDEFGPDFKSKYGWAVGYVAGGRNPKFTDLAAKADHSAMHSYYKYASYNVHASSRSFTQRVGTIDDPGLMIAGATNAGIEEPGARTATTLVQLTAAILGSSWKLDELVLLQVLINLRDSIHRALERAARNLRREELLLEQERERRRAKRKR